MPTSDITAFSPPSDRWSSTNQRPRTNSPPQTGRRVVTVPLLSVNHARGRAVFENNGRALWGCAVRIASRNSHRVLYFVCLSGRSYLSPGERSAGPSDPRSATKRSELSEILMCDVMYDSCCLPLSASSLSSHGDTVGSRMSKSGQLLTASYSFFGNYKSTVKVVRICKINRYDTKI